MKLLCGDAYELIKEIPDKSVDLIYTDIPYLFDNHGGGNQPLGERIGKVQSELGDKNVIRGLEKKLQMFREKMDHAETKSEYEKYHCLHSNILNQINLQKASIVSGIDYKILDEFVRIQPYIYIYIWCSKAQIYDLMEYFYKKHNCRYNILVWCKTNCVPATNDTWLPNVEYCLLFKEKGTPRYNDGIENKSKWYITSTNKADKELYNHPTIKPLELVKRHLLHSTKPGDTILDPFMGSGTTGVACKELGRDFIGFEIDKDYYNIAVDRINGITVKDRKLRDGGQLNIFDLMEE